MMRRRFRLYFFVLLLLLAVPIAALTQTEVKPGMNLFSIRQDIAIGRDAARQIEHQMPMLNDTQVNDYLSRLGRRLTRHSSMPDLPWRFKVVNSPEINAFALPGGFIYVNRGLVEAARSEGQLVGVLAHEISHVTLRHGTNQLSKGILAQAPLAVFGGLLGNGLVGQLSQLGMAVGANLIFMKFSRTAETQADIAGTQLMVKAGYDPEEMIHMFEIMESLRKREPSKLEQWFSSHPTPERRIERIEQEIALMRPRGDLVRNSPHFDSIRTRLLNMSPAPRATFRATSNQRRSKTR